MLSECGGYALTGQAVHCFEVEQEKEEFIDNYRDIFAQSAKLS